MEVLRQQFQLEDTNWDLVKTRTLGQGAIYLSAHGDRYLRVGSNDSIRDEAELAKSIHDIGFPVPEVLSEGAIDANTYYFTESSLGTKTFGDTFREEYGDSGTVDKTSFGQYCRVASLFLVAQLKSAPICIPILIRLYV